MDGNYFETQRCAILSHACSRDEMGSFCSVCVVTHRTHLYMPFEWVFSLHLPPDGCLEVFLQSTETGPNSEKFHESSDHEECLEFQLLVFQMLRSQFVDEDEAVGRSPRNLQPVRRSTAWSYSSIPSNACPFRCLIC